MKDLKYSEILRLNKEIGNNLKSNPYKITILSNITVHQIKDILEYLLRTEGVNARVVFGDYDNIVQDSLKYKDSNLNIIFWEMCNIIDGLQYKVELFNDYQVDEVLEKTKLEINLVLKNLKKTSLVLFNKFTPLAFSISNIRKNIFDKLTGQLNQYLEERISVNIKLVDIEKPIAKVGVNGSLDLRYYYSSKALYTIDFFKAYAEYVKPFILSVNGKSRKAIIFDCDNTLWKGILGEDGFDNIEMSTETKAGAIFSEIQSIALELSKQGILIGICSRNNPQDVDEVITSHPDMQLRSEHITINKSNWSDKITNLREIARNLNIGLDSLVFVDDSSFEVNLIREQLSEIKVLQVPERLYDYPKMLRENMGLFYNLSFVKEDGQKIKMYKQQVQRESTKNKFLDIEGYLSSLELKLTVFEDDHSLVPRMSQISQKTNQFNLTTKRYTEGDIINFIVNDDSKVFAFSVSDKYGDNGVTGLCIVNIDSKTQTADINTFLMSCRIIGRNIEYSFMDYLMNELGNHNIYTVTAQYVKTQKNEQVKDFYNKCSFLLTESDSTFRNYTLDMREYIPKQLNYIEIINGR